MGSDRKKRSAVPGSFALKIFFGANLAFSVVSLIPASLLLFVEGVPDRLAYSIIFVVVNYVATCLIGLLYFPLAEDFLRRGRSCQ